MKKEKLIIVLSTIAVLISFGLMGWMYTQKEAKEVAEAAKQNETSLERSYSPKLGNPNAKVTLVEFLDPECESCRAFYPYVKKLLKDNEGQVRLVVRYALFHRNSGFVATMLEGIRKQGKYWEAMELFFEKLPEWGSHHNPQPQRLWTYLPELGIDIDKLKKDMQDPKIIENIKQDIVDGKTLGVRATPTFYINGEPLKEFGYIQLKNAIEAQL
jgi:protein-disulfide isomerase